MNAPRCCDEDYTQFPIAAPRLIRCDRSGAHAATRPHVLPRTMSSHARCTASHPTPRYSSTRSRGRWSGAGCEAVDDSTHDKPNAQVDNFQLVRDCGWRWLTQLKHNRLVNVRRTELRSVSACTIAASDTVVWLKDYGEVRVFRVGVLNGTTEHWAMNDLGMGEMERLKYAQMRWRIEVYNLSLRGACHVEHAMGQAGRSHIGLSIRARCLKGRTRFERHREDGSELVPGQASDYSSGDSYVSCPSLASPRPICIVLCESARAISGGQNNCHEMQPLLLMLT